MTTKKKAKAPAADAPPDPREPLAPTAENLQKTLAALKAVLADLTPPAPVAPEATAASPGDGGATSGAATTGGASAAGGASATGGSATGGSATTGRGTAPTVGVVPPLDLVDAMIHFYFADGHACGYGQEARRRIADGFVDRNEFRVTEAFEVEDLLRDLPIPNLFDRCLAVRDSVAQIYNDQNGVNLGFLRDAGISDRNTFFQRVPAVQPQVANFLTNLLTLEELCFSEKSTLRAQQRLGLEVKDAHVGKFLDEVRALLKPYGCLPLDVGPNLAGRKVNLKHPLSPACLLARLAPAGKRR